MFDTSVFFEPRIWHELLQGLKFSATVTVCAMIGGILLGTPLAMMRLSKNPFLSRIAKWYVDFFRAIPLIQIIILFYFLLPTLIAIVLGKDYPTPLGHMTSAIITFAIFEAAYYSEIVRAGIQAIGKNQISAGYAMGFSYAQTMKHVILPQAFRNMTPVFLTQTIVLFQDITLVDAIGARDLLGSANLLKATDPAHSAEYILMVAIIYLVLCFTLSRLVRKLQNKIAIIR